MEVISANQKELAKFLQYGVYEEVSDFGKPRIGTDRVVTPKIIDKPDIKQGSYAGEIKPSLKTQLRGLTPQQSRGTRSR